MSPLFGSQTEEVDTRLGRAQAAVEAAGYGGAENRCSRAWRFGVGRPGSEVVGCEVRRARVFECEAEAGCRGCQDGVWARDEGRMRCFACEAAMAKRRAHKNPPRTCCRATDSAVCCGYDLQKNRLSVTFGRTQTVESREIWPSLEGNPSIWTMMAPLDLHTKSKILQTS